MNSQWPELKRLLLEAPSEQLDPIIFPLINQWDNPPTSLQILQVVDHVVNSSLGSDFTTEVLNIMLQTRLAQENKILDDIIPLAHWRNR